MQIIWSIVWGALTAAVMWLTITYYLPRLEGRTRSAALTEPQQTDHGLLRNHRLTAILLIAGCAGIAAWCGWVTAAHARSVTALLRMTLAMAVLSCIFVTDTELMLIPNICPLILVAGRLILWIPELILSGKPALMAMAGSCIAGIGSLLFLLVMAGATRGGLGMGDVKLLSSLGFLCGLRAVCYTLVLSFFLCAVSSLVLLAVRKRTLKDALPMGPFIWLGFAIPVLLSII